MKTYQDWLKIPQDEKQIMDFVVETVQQYCSSKEYKQAEIATDYARHRNRTIVEYQKFLYAVSGEVVPDNYTANYKLSSNFFGRFVTQQVQYLLGNGVTWKNEDTKEKLGKTFDEQLQKVARHALVEGVGYGFFNKDHIDVFSSLEFAPLWDEENGSLRAGVRFWQIEPKKPMRMTFYEEDGYTDYERKDGEVSILHKKRPYILIEIASDADAENGDVIYDGVNYPTFPIVPLWGNQYKQSELVGIREQIDCYDLIKSGYADTIDEASFVYWSINNAGGMDDLDIATFMDRVRRLRAAITTDFNASAEPHQIEAPYQARGELLDRLRADLYEDYMALDTKNLASGAITATQIEAAYEPVNSKADDFEFCVTAFVDGILETAGIEDEPTYTRSMVINREEEIQTILLAAPYLEPEYAMQKILTILGDGDRFEELLDKINSEGIAQVEETEEETEEEADEVTEDETA